MKNISFIIVGIIAFTTSGFFLAQMLTFMGEDELRKYYVNEKFGISFRYPGNYFLEEKEVGDGHRYHYLITLTDDTEENRLVREGKSPGREGPVAITFNIYQNNLDMMSPESWLKGTNQSNFKLSDGNYQKTAVAGKEALSYKWSGLYEADALVFSHGDNLISATVTYIEPSEKIRTDFPDIVSSIMLK